MTERVANRLFLMFCNDEEYREAYEFYDALEQGQETAKDRVRADGNSFLSDVRTNELPILRT